ncbi:uncharacterized protein LOC114521475 [Dendronephthya gigantea]|uniref:uncharacterized protein LOC114521475 n=1 Tax=Dendronephthya gigantea TaxID=151771 RepID=UPI001069F5E7|nr:uncharacterized protein LOC114521475 [Dendronephthya gigantea]
MSNEDLLTKFDGLVKRFKNEFDEIIEAERVKMNAEVEAFNEEKKRMQAFVVRDDDIIHLNVGGQKFKTKRSTLCQIEGSLLAAMFSGRWEDGVERDQDGAVFFDFNPQHFAYILDYLREKKITSGKKPASLPDFPESQMKWFSSLVDYLGLSDEIFPTEIVSDEKFNLHCPGLTLQEDGKVAVHCGAREHKYVLGENIYQQGIVNLKLKLESFKDNDWMFIGIVKGDFVPPDRSSYIWRGSYGWALGSDGYQGAWEEGSRTYYNTLVNLTKQGDEVKLILDFDADKMSLHLPSGHEFHIHIPKNNTWRLNVDMTGANDKIRIINE